MPAGVPPIDGSVASATSTGSLALSGGLWNGLRETLPQLYTLIQSIVAARVLGPADMGRQSYIAWASLTIKVFVTGGLPVALVRSVGEWVGRGRPGQAAALVRIAWRIELVGAGVAAAVVAVIGLGQPGFHTAWLWAAVACLLAVLHSVPYSVLLGTQQWRRAARIGLAQGAFATAATVAVLLAGAGVAGMFAVEAAAAAVSLAFTTVLARRALTADEHPLEAHDRRAFLRYASAASVLVLLELVVWKRSEFFFLGRYGSAVALAQYSVAFAMASAVARIPQGIASVITPTVATLYGAGSLERIRIGYGRSFRLVLSMTLAVTAATVALGPRTLEVVYGEEYTRAANVLLLLLVSFPLVPLASLGMGLLQGVGHVGRSIVAIAAAAVVDVGLAIVLVPHHAEAGAAVANVGAQLVGGALLVLFANRAAGGLDPGLRTLAGTAVTSLAAGLAARYASGLVGGPSGVLVGALAGLVTFVALARPCRILRADDARWLRETAGSRLGGVVGRVATVFADERS